MKTLTTMILTLLIFTGLQAQRIVEESHPVDSNTEVHLEFDFADEINIQSWNKNEVYVKATVQLNDGELNEKFKFNVKKSKDYLYLESEIEDLKNMHCQTIIIEDGDTTIINGIGTRIVINFEVFLPGGQELTVETINGDLVIKGMNGPLDLSTINGDIDLFIAENQGADLEMETINGTMYTDLDMQITNKKGSMCKVGGDVHTKLNGGGLAIQLSTINGTMFLRKN